MRYSIAAAGLAVALAFSSTAFVADDGMGTGENGYGCYHESNSAATGWGTQNNGYEFYHESNGSEIVRGVQLH
jgi:hypothetical protein